MFARGSQQLEGELEIVRAFSENIRMNFGLDKCAKIEAKRGKYVEEQDITLRDGNIIKELGTENTYKYLGIHQSYGIKQKKHKGLAEHELIRRINKILSTHLNSKNKINAINFWAIPVSTYTAGIIAWSKTDLERLDRKIRTLLTRRGMLHPNSAIERVYLPRDEGGRGLMSLEANVQKEKDNLRQYFRSNGSAFHRAIVAWDRNYTQLNMSSSEEPEGGNC